MENPPASYYKVLRAPVDAMENTTQLFLAVRFNCNKCHDHPFERWTQDQYYQLAAYFAHVGRKASPSLPVASSAAPLSNRLCRCRKSSTTRGRRSHARAHRQVSAPSFPYQYVIRKPPRRRPRGAINWPHWITSKDNPYFAKSYVNRIWSYLLGVGIIEPIDDIRAGNPPTNPELARPPDGQDFIASGFNVQELFREICKSRSLSAVDTTNKWNQDDESIFRTR